MQGKVGRTRVRRSTTAGRARDTRSHLTKRIRCHSFICLLSAPFEWPFWELQGHLTLMLRGALTRLPPRLPRWRQAGPPSSRHGPGRAAPACPGASLHPRTPGAAGSPSAAQRPGQRGVSKHMLLPLPPGKGTAHLAAQARVAQPVGASIQRDACRDGTREHLQHDRERCLDEVGCLVHWLRHAAHAHATRPRAGGLDTSQRGSGILPGQSARAALHAEAGHGAREGRRGAPGRE